MKRFASITILSVILVMVVSSTAFGGNIAGGRAAGNIAGGRATGNIAGGRAAAYLNPSAQLNAISRADFEGVFSGTFTGLIRMLLESGALL